MREAFLKYQVPHSSLHVLVPQAVDDGVEHGGHHPIEKGNEFVCKVLFVCSQWVLRLGLPVHEEDGPVEDDHTVRWAEQVEKAFFLPSAEGILRMVAMMKT